MIPKLRFPEFKSDWTTVKVEEEYLFKNGLNKEKEFFGRGFSIVNFTDVYHNPILSMSQCKGLVDVNESEKDRFKVSYGDIMFTRTSETIHDIGMSSAIVDEEVNAVFSGFVLRATPQRNNLTPHFAGYLFRSPSVRKEIVRKSSFTTRALTSGTSLSAVSISYPSNLEQVKIASLLHLIDQKINLLTKKKEALETYKKGLMQKIFSQELRFKREDGTDYPEWEKVRIGDVFTVTRGKVLATSLTKQEPNESYIYPVYSSQTKMNGLMGFYDEFLFSDSITWTTDGANAGEVRFRKGKFYCTNVCGVLLSDKYANTAVSIAINRVTHKYVSYVGNPKLMNGVMSEIALLLPTSSEEIGRVSRLFEKLEDEISVIQKRIEAVDKLKKGLLQQMFV